MTFTKVLQQLGLGAAIGLGIGLLVSLFGFSGGQGWSPGAASKALSIVLIIMLVSLLSIVVRSGYGHHFRLKTTPEEHERRVSLIPFVFAMTTVVLAMYLWISPPTVPPMP